MKIKWYGQSAFLLTSNDGTHIVTDPYEPNAFDGAVGYGPITDKAEVVLVSHEHGDHNYVKGVPGNPVVVRGTGNHTPAGIHVKGVSTFHDKSRGKERGPNTVFVIEMDKMRICHLGDLGHELTASDASLIGPIDILLIPVGGFYTIDAKEATHVADRLQPKLVIPMHYKTEKCGFPIGEVEPFLHEKKVQRLNKSEVDITPNNLPTEMEVWVLQYAN